MNLVGFLKGLLLQDDTDRTKQLSVSVSPSATTGTTMAVTAVQTANRTVTIPDATDTLVGKATTDTLTNKSIDATTNIVTNIADTSVKTGANINANKIGTGAVDNTHLNYLQNVTSDIQSQFSSQSSATATVQSNLTAHITQTPGAHTASAITNVPSGNLTATDAQSAMNQLQTEIDGISAGTSNGANVGSGTGLIFRDKTSNTLNLKTLIAGSNITITNNANDITIAGAASGANQTLSNLTNPTSINTDLVFDNTTFRTIKPADNVASGAGQALNIQAGSATTGTNHSSGALTLSSGSSTGSAGSGGFSVLLAPSGNTSGSSVVSATQVLGISSTLTANTLQLLSPNTSTNNGLQLGSAPTSNSISTQSLSLPGGTTPSLTIQTGVNTDSTGTDGSLSILTPAATHSGTSGNLQINTGSNTAGTSGSLTLTTGNSTGTSGIAGTVTIQGGDALNTNGSGGSVTIVGGRANGTGGASGNISLTARSGGSGGADGQISLSAPSIVMIGAIEKFSTNTYSSYGTTPTNALVVGNNYNVIVQSTTPITVNGIVAGTTGQEILLYNNSSNNMSLVSASGSASAANQLITAAGTTVTLGANACARLNYLNSKWVVTSHT